VMCIFGRGGIEEVTSGSAAATEHEHMYISVSRTGSLFFFAVGERGFGCRRFAKVSAPLVTCKY
jgi:hypothetical protein